MREVVIVGGMRTPIGDFLGSLKDFTAVELGIIALKAALNKAGIEPEHIEEVVAGMGNMSGCRPNPARQVALGAGCAVETVAVTVNQQCASSMRATEILAQEIMLGKVDAGAAVGPESMTNIPYYLPSARKGFRMDNHTVIDGMFCDGLIDAFYNYHMGVTAENLAKMYGITRREQDELALLSHQRACRAIREGTFKDEIIPVEKKTRKGTVIIDTDEHPRQDANLDDLAKLPPVFDREGTVTAGNASSLNDGAAAMVLMSSEKARELGCKPLARIVATASGAVDPKIMGIGVVPAVKRALHFAGLKINDIDLWEMNEAFASQVIACNRELNLSMDNVNVNGSGISLGHPVSCTGVRLVVSLLNEMQRRGARLGCATMCAGGGPGAAVIIETVS